MSLDKLYRVAKTLAYPIKDMNKLETALGDISITFESTKYDARTIANVIDRYPIDSPVDLIGFFLEGSQDYENELASEFQETLEYESEA